jgi:hypothetical protein
MENACTSHCYFWHLWPFGIFRGHSVYFVAIWCILSPFGIFYGHLVYFFVFAPWRIWQPWWGCQAISERSRKKLFFNKFVRAINSGHQHVLELQIADQKNCHLGPIRLFLHVAIYKSISQVAFSFRNLKGFQFLNRSSATHNIVKPYLGLESNPRSIKTITIQNMYFCTNAFISLLQRTNIGY